MKERVKQWRIEEGNILVSFDVKNLYQSIPVKKAMDLIKKLLEDKANIRNITNI